MRNRRELTDSEKAIALSLRAIWDSKKKELGLSQMKAAHDMGFSSQATVSQFLRGFIPLNTDAKLKFSKLLGVPVTDFDPAFSENAQAIASESAVKEFAAVVQDLGDDDIMRVRAFVAGIKSSRDK